MKRVLCLLSSIYCIAGAPANYDLTLFDTMGSENSGCSFISDGGVILGVTWTNWYNLPPITNGFIWREGRMLSVQNLTGYVSSSPLAVNASGRIVGAVSSGFKSPPRAAMWNLDGVPTPIDPIPTGTQSVARAVTADGTVLLQLHEFHSYGAVWNNGKLNLLTLPGSGIAVSDMNERMEVTGTHHHSYGYHPVLIRDGIVTQLPGVVSTGGAFGINESGTVVGEVDFYPAKWTENGRELLPTVGITRRKGYAADINDVGDIVGGMTLPNGRTVGLLWRADGEVVPLMNFVRRGTGITSLSATSINNEGQMVGTAWLSDNTRRGFLLTPRN